MNEADVFELVRAGIWAAVWAVGPVLAVALLVGFGISLLQALTQLQEATLSFVPKIIAMLVTIVLALPFMYGVLATFTEQVVARIGGAP